MQLSAMQVWSDVEVPGLILIVLASVVVIVASIIALICCCHGPTVKDRKSHRYESAEEKTTASVAIVSVAPDEASEAEALSRAAERQPDTVTGNAAEELPVESKHNVPADGIPILTPDAHGDMTAAAASNTDNQKDDTSAREEKARDFSTIRNARVNVKLALAAYEIGQVPGSSASAEKPVLRAPRKKLDAAFKDQIIIRPGKPNMQRHTVAADKFHELEDHQENNEDGVEDHSKQEAKKVLPDLLTVTPRRTSGKSYLSPASAGASDGIRTSTEDDRKSSGSRSSEAEKDYFGVVQRQDAVLRSVEKVKAPHKHKKGKVPTVDGVQANSAEDSDDFQRIRPHSSGNILD